MKQNLSNSEAVSPVIGVIGRWFELPSSGGTDGRYREISSHFLPAQTVILAAVIAAFVFGMSGNLGQGGKIVAVGVDQNGNNDITVMYYGGADSSSLEVLNISVEGYYDDLGTAGTILPVGSQLTMTGNGTAGQDHVVVVGKFNDGMDSVVYDGYV